MKKIFLIWSWQYDKIKRLISALEGRGHKIVYWVSTGNDSGKIPGAVFHNYFDAYQGLPAPGLAVDQFPPPSRRFIKQYAQLESLILTLMNKRFPELCVDKRKHLYYNMLGYWQGVFKKHKPDVIIFNSIPHSVFNYIVYQFALDRGIKTIMFDNTWIADRMIMYNDWQKGSSLLQNEIEKNKGRNFSLEDLSPGIREYYKLQTDIARDATPVHTKYYKKHYSSKKTILAKKIKTAKELFKEGIFLQRGVKYIIKQFKPNLKKEYLSLQSQFIPEEKFVYLPLHFQPECSICPQGDVYWDQILMAETLSFALPKNWLLYVKEHPIQWLCKSGTNYSCNRYQGYYRRMAKLKNVRLMPVETDSFTLIKYSQAVATATGTAGWEAILKDKPALIFGLPEYRDCPCLFRVDDAESCRAALEKIAQGFKVKQQEIINYLKSFDKATIPAVLDPLVEKLTQADSHKGINAVIKVILSEVENI